MSISRLANAIPCESVEELVEKELVQTELVTKRRVDELHQSRQRQTDEISEVEDVEERKASSKQTGVGVTSYGGTFHVSKNAVPMPGPCTCKQLSFYLKLDLV